MSVGMTLGASSSAAARLSSRKLRTAPVMHASAMAGYVVGGHFDEMFSQTGVPRPECVAIYECLNRMAPSQLVERQSAAERLMRQRGITFSVYDDPLGSERIIPFDVIPRVVSAREWRWIERGLQQRIQALNAFLQDIYSQQQIIRDGILPRELVETATGFRRVCVGLMPPHDIWAHIVGTDLIRDQNGRFHVLEDNLRCPSGVSYVLQNRQLMKQTFSELFAQNSICSVDEYCSRLLASLCQLMPGIERPSVALLTPGAANSAYYEHSFLAQQMGIQLVEGRDLTIHGGKVCVRTTRGLQPLDVIYRRIDDDFLDPTVFRNESLLGVPGIMDAYYAGRVALANAPGTGVADDKAIYAFVPDFIRYYLQQEAIIPNVPTFSCWSTKERQHVLANLDQLVVKPVDESGGYGLMIGPLASASQRAAMADHIKSHPRNYVAQPTLNLSRAPVVTNDGLAGRHVDLRPFGICGEEIYILPGGLTRVALQTGSLVVNSSQGGGSKDTWVLTDSAQLPRRHRGHETVQVYPC